MIQSSLTLTSPRREPSPQEYIDSAAESGNTFVATWLGHTPGVSPIQALYIAHEVEMVIRRELSGVYGLDKPRLAVREEDVPLVVIGQGAGKTVIEPEDAGSAVSFVLWALAIIAAAAFVIAWLCKW